MSRPSFLFRPDLRKADHRQAWDMLDAQPSGFKNEFLAQAILCAQRQESMETMLRRVLNEQLGSVAQGAIATATQSASSSTLGSAPQVQPSDETAVPDFMLDFLGQLEQ